MKKIFAALSVVVPFILYFITLAPDVYFTDSGELASVAATLGIAHPTGYPLFAILGHIWTLLLPWEAIYDMNLFAAVTTSFSCLFFFLTTHLLSEKTKFKKRLSLGKSMDYNMIISLIVTYIYAFALTVWQQGVAVEVYSLQLLMITSFLYVLFKAYYSNENTYRYFLLAALILGLGFSNHLTSFMMLPAAFIVYFSKYKELPVDKKYKNLLGLLLVFLIGISLYLYLPLRSSMQPIFNWGEVHRGWDKFIYHVTGEQYRVWMFDDASTMKENIKKFFTLLPSQLTWIGIFFTLYGIGVTFRRNRILFYILLSNVLICVLYSSNYSIHDIDSYFLTAYLSLILFLGIGIYQLVHLYDKLIYLFTLIPAFLIFTNFNDVDLSDDHSVSEYTRIVTENAEENAVIISAQWDYWVSAFWYKDKVENVRQDIALIEKELLRRTWYVKQLERWYPEICEPCNKQIDSYMEQLELFESDEKYDNRAIQSRFINMINCFVETNIDERPVYMTFDIMHTDSDIAKNYAKIPEGFLIRLAKREEAMHTNYDKIDINKFHSSIRGKTSDLYQGIKTAALVNLRAAYKYAYNKNDTASAQIIYEKLKILENKE